MGPRLPDFLLLGAAKSGTSSVFQYLAQHPRIFLPDNKEPYFFSFEGTPDHCRDPAFRRLLVVAQDEYERLFADAGPGQLAGEASTSYLYTYERTIPAISRAYAGRDLPRMFAVLRNPVDRAFSHYSYLVRNGVESLPFREAISDAVADERMHDRYWDFDYVRYGMYARQVAAYQAAFPHTRFFLFEDLREPHAVMDAILADLGLPTGFAFSTDFVANPSGRPRNRLVVGWITGPGMVKSALKALLPRRFHWFVMRARDRILARLLERMTLDGETRALLVERYRDDVLRLQDTLGRDLSAWLEAK